MEFMNVTIKYTSGDTRIFRTTHNQYCEFWDEIYDFYGEQVNGSAPFKHFECYIQRGDESYELHKIQINCLHILSIEHDGLPPSIQKLYKKAQNHF